MKIRLVYSFVRILLCAAFALPLLPQLLAQEITHETPATREQLNAWLQSKDPRLVAWAATLARERKEAAFISTLPEWLKESPLIRDYGYSPTPEDNRAYDAVLDALIRGGSEPAVDARALRDLGRTYPIQAFLLLERLPLYEQLPVLREWFGVWTLSREGAVLAHLAAMRLAQWPTPVPEFTARLITDSEEQLTVELRATPGQAEGKGYGTCGDSMSQPPAVGWPVVYWPLAEESTTIPGTNTTLIALDDDSVSYRWVEENAPGGTCNGLRELDQRTRHQIVAHWLGQTQNAMQWQIAKSVTIVWTTRAAYESALGRLIEYEDKSFGAMTERLVQSGQLSASEAMWARPKLVVHIVCEMEPCPIQGAASTLAPYMLFPFL